MILSAEGIGKRYGTNWIFKDHSFEFSAGDRVAITGNNGSGKSTMLQILAGYLTATRGAVSLNGMPVSEAPIEIGLIGPYVEIIEEFTLQEFLSFHSKFKKQQMNFEEMADRATLPLHLPITAFSTGMKQRAKLITAFYFENQLLFMDEPTANLDSEGTGWWNKEVALLPEKCLLFVASNQKSEITTCSKEINLKKNTDH